MGSASAPSPLCFHGDISLLGSTCIMPSHTRDSHGRSPAFRSVPPPPTPPAPPPPLHRRLTSDVGHMLQDLFACLSPLITPLSTLRLQRGVVGEVCCPLVHYFSLPSVLFFFFFSLTAAEQRSCNNSLKDTWSCGLFMRGCRMWDSASGKKLRNPPVYTHSLPPHCTIGGCFPRTSFTLSNLCRR